MVSDTGLFRGALDINEIHPRTAEPPSCARRMLAESANTPRGSALVGMRRRLRLRQGAATGFASACGGAHPTVVSRSCKLFFRSATAAGLRS